MSPSITSSPLPPNLIDPKVGRSSPAPSTASTRPVVSRARQSSVASNNDARPRPSSSASNRPNGIGPPTVETSTSQAGSKTTNENRTSTADMPNPVKAETAKDSILPPGITASSSAGGSRKNSVAKEEAEPKADAAQPPYGVVTTVVTTKSGRASKPSTPALGNFPEPIIRSRLSRNTQGGKEKRSHKKGAAAQAAFAAQTADEDANSSVQDGDDDNEVDPHEPRYCYCNGVSYGEMVACDADDCEKEWFHLGCVGLKSAPSSSSESMPRRRLLLSVSVGNALTAFCAAKWFCDNCKNRMKNGKKLNGR
jgi:hypothetical protein